MKSWSVLVKTRSAKGFWTPRRAAKAMQYLCNGYAQDLHEVVNGALFESENDEMIVVRDIELYSLCEHHMLPFIGKAHVAYLPTGRVLGLSRLHAWWICSPVVYRYRKTSRGKLRMPCRKSRMLQGWGS